jgi:inhibitor of cysteine peptidase
LSVPTKPVMTGELKIPGYSSYLHPLTDTLILGIGKEGSKVKLSMFDVSDVSNPQEIDKYSLDEYHSEALNNHHAFLMDAQNEVFFLPGSKGGYVFSYSNNEFEMLKAVGENQVKRALYLDDYLYVIASESITVLDMKNWVEISEFDIITE